MNIKVTRNKLFITISILVVFIFLAVFAQKPAYAQEEVASGTCGENLTWVLDDEGTLTISGTGEMPRYTNKTQPWNSYLADIKRVVINEGATIISSYAFYNCIGLTAVSLPESLTGINDYAFSGCTGLEDLTLPSHIESIGTSAFASTRIVEISIPASLCNENQKTVPFGIASLKEVTFENGASMIPNGIFSDCTGIESVDLPESVESIGINSFKNCSSLTAIDLPEGLTSINNFAFSDCTSLSDVTLPSGLKTLGNRAFYNCQSLKKINIPNTIEEVTGSTTSYYPFERSGISTIEFEEGITKINRGLFSYCFSLESVTIPESVTIIGQQAFYNCHGLTTVELPSGLKSIGKEAFKNTIIAEINIPAPLCNEEQNEKLFGTNTLKKVTFESGAEMVPQYIFYDCSGLETVVLPDSITRIGLSAFYNCTSLTSINIPDDLTVIESSAFYNCTGLTEIKLPEGLTDIGRTAFRGCTSLTGVVLPSSLKTLGEEAFYQCTGLEKVNIPKSLEDKANGYGSFMPFGGSGIKSVEFEEGITRINKGLFAYCSFLENVTLPDTIKEIGAGAFNNCKGLTSIKLPSNLELLGTNAFSGTSIESITIPASLCNANQKESAFSGSSLKTAYIENGAVMIPDYLFNSCANLETVEIPESVTSIGYVAFGSCKYLKAISLPEGLTSIDRAAFSNCYAIEEVILPSTLKTLEGRAFEYCKGLEKVYIPAGLDETGDSFSFSNYGPFMDSGVKTIIFGEGIAKINNGLFYGCSSLESITIPDSVTAIGAGAFYSCRNLKDITIPDSVKKIGSLAFDGVSNQYIVHTNYGSYAASYFPSDHLDCICDHIWDDHYTTDSEPTCTEPGSESIHCQRCGAAKDTREIPALGHAFGEWVEIKPSTCVDSGLKQHTCERCGFVESENLDPKGHKWEDDYTVDVEPGCTTDGSKSIHCKNCDAVKNSTVIPATGHSYGDWTTTKEPACIEEGLKEKVCSVCGDKVTETIPANGHTWNTDYTVDVPATCTEEGSESIHCAVCNAQKEGTSQPVAMIPHDIVENVTKATLEADGLIECKCSHCGFVESTTVISKPKTIKLSATTFVYDGKVKKPNVTVKDASGNTIASSNYEVTYASGRKAIGKYKVTIKFKDDSNYTGQKALNFTIKPPKVTGLKLTSPKAKQLKVTYSKASGGVSYQIWYKVKGTSTWKKTTATGTSKLIKSLKGGKTYQVKVRAFKKVNGTTYYGNYSVIKTIKVKK